MPKQEKQEKKDENDPDIHDINPILIQFAKDIGFLRGPFNLYLHGVITYREALETMLIVITREYRQIMSRIIKKPIKQRVDHSDLIQLPPSSSAHPLALPNKHDDSIEIETAQNHQDGILPDEGSYSQDN